MAKRDWAASDAPLYRQLEQSFIADIEAGRLKPGDAVPSTYSLSEQYGISRVTAVRCYEELKGRGFLTARRGGGTIVNPFLVLPGPAPRHWQADCPLPYENADFDIRLSGLSRQPPGLLLPARAWMKTMQAVVDAGFLESFAAAERLVIAGLQQALAAFLMRTRGMSVYPKNILLFDSKWQALAFLHEHWLEAGDAVAVENPGDRLAHYACRLRSLNLRPMDLDREGAVVERLEPRSGVRLIVVSPSAQIPTGVIMSERRRQQLARYAGQNQCLILEDDGAALLRYGKQPEPSLFNKYREALHVGSFGEYLGPLCRLSYLVVPDHLLACMKSGHDVNTLLQPRLEHVVLTRMIESGAMDQALFRLRSALTKRRQDWLSMLCSEFNDILSVNAGAAGYDLVVRFHSRFASDQVLSAVEDSGLASKLLTRFYLEQSDHRRIEMILPLAECESNLTDRLYALKRQLLSGSSQNFAPALPLVREFLSAGHSFEKLNC